MADHTFNPSPPSAWDGFLAGERAKLGIQLVVCPQCSRRRMDLGGPHSPHWRDGVKVDCVGNEVPPRGEG